MTPRPMRAHKAALDLTGKWTFHRIRMGKAANRKSETAEKTCIGQSIPSSKWARCNTHQLGL